MIIPNIAVGGIEGGVASMTHRTVASDSRSLEKASRMNQPLTRDRKPSVRENRLSILLFSFLMVLSSAPKTIAATYFQQLKAQWLGQVETDQVGRSSTPGPSGIQDVVIEVTGIPRGLQIKQVRIQGFGGDEWYYQGPHGPYAALLERSSRSTSVRLSIEPSRVETGRRFTMTLVDSRGRSAQVRFQGGRADPNLRMPEVALQATWKGPSGSDYTSPAPVPGPDGIEDLQIALNRLDPDQEIRSIDLRSTHEGAGTRWVYGPDRSGSNSAHFVRHPSEPTQGTVYFSQLKSHEPGPLLVGVRYENGTTDETKVLIPEGVNVRSVQPPSPPTIQLVDHRSTWYGVLPQSTGGLGLVGVEVERPTDLGPIHGAVLSDGNRGAWVFERPRGASKAAQHWLRDSRIGKHSELALARGRNSGSILVQFQPYRDPGESTYYLRLIDESGRQVVIPIKTKSVDISSQFEEPIPGGFEVDSIVSLKRALERGGTIRIRPGVYRFRSPLRLERPVHLIGALGVEIVFQQRSGSPPWDEAISIRGAGLTTIEDVRIGFEGSVFWNRRAPRGPAIIGVPEQDGVVGPIRFTLKGSTLEAPLATSDWEPAPLLLRLVGATSGIVDSNQFQGGPIEVAGGPWRFSNNTHQGPVHSTNAYSMISAHHVYDFDLVDNEVIPDRTGGKLWRFAVITNRGSGVRILRNRVIGVGPRDDDLHEHPNAPEVLLTESYRLRFEGRPLGRLASGRILVIPEPQGSLPETGDVVAVVAGKPEGWWTRVVQVIDRNHLLLEDPMPEDVRAVTVGPAFTEMKISGNTIDSTGSTIANNLVLTGNHYGTEISENALIGGRSGFRIHAFATEKPLVWGWSRTPCFDLKVTKNEIRDAREGGWINVFHNEVTRSSIGRLYLTAVLSENEFHWTESNPTSDSGGWTALTIGSSESIDPGESRVESYDNLASVDLGRAPERPVRIHSGTFNGVAHSITTPPGVSRR